MTMRWSLVVRSGKIPSGVREVVMAAVARRAEGSGDAIWEYMLLVGRRAGRARAVMTGCVGNLAWSSARSWAVGSWLSFAYVVAAMGVSSGSSSWMSGASWRRACLICAAACLL